MRCAQCTAEWTLGETPWHRDQVLDGLVNQLAAASVDLGRCYNDPYGQILGGDLSPSIAWHAQQASAVEALKVAIHNHVQENYEEEDD
jgi:hypothetical protein